MNDALVALCRHCEDCKAGRGNLQIAQRPHITETATPSGLAVTVEFLGGIRLLIEGRSGGELGLIEW